MKVIKFRLNGKIFTLNKEDGRYYSEDGNWANYCETLDEGSVVEIENLTVSFGECEIKFVSLAGKEKLKGSRVTMVEDYF